MRYIFKGDKVKNVIAILFSIAFLLSGCSQQSALTPEKEMLFNSHVVIEDSKMTKWFRVENVVSLYRDDEMLEFEITAKNILDKPKTFAYRVDWYDKNGMSIKTILTKWTIVKLEARRNIILRKISPSKGAIDFKVVFQELTDEDKLRDMNTYKKEYIGD